MYNLVRDNSYFGAQGANRLYEEKQNLRDTLDRWNQAEINGQNETPHMLVYSLDHQYTEASLKLSSMKAEDYVKAKCLQELCLELDMCFILGNVERRIDGECDEYSDREGFHSIQDEDPRDITRLHYMTDYNGSAVMRGHLSSYLFEIKLDLEDFVSNPYGDDRSLDHEDFSGDTGNEGTNATHTYRDTVSQVLTPYILKILSDSVSIAGALTRTGRRHFCETKPQRVFPRPSQKRNHQMER